MLKRTRIVFFYVLILFFCAAPPPVSTAVAAEQGSTALKTFQYDGCTLFPEGTRAQPQLWSECCREHDLYYWAGGSRSKRRAADRALRDCVSAKGAPGVARLMYLGVIAGSRSPVKVPGQNWGNAWGRSTRYAPLSRSQIHQLDQETRNYEISPEMRERLLRSLEQDQPF
jgi:hypothetical protein